MMPPHDDFAGELFDALRSLSADGDGVTRGSYSAAEGAAHDLIASTAERYGLKVWSDQACNTWVELNGSAPDLPAIVLGSHLDSVRRGGNFDGAAGVVAGLITLLRLKDGPTLQRTVRVVAFRGEESDWFGTCYIGSRALVGTLPPEALTAIRTEPRISLREAMTESGANLELIDAQHPLIDLDTIALYLELHIEQGPALVAAKVPVGAVTGIRGNHRYSHIVWSGVPGHSGAVPRDLRSDAVLGAARWLVALDDLWDEAERSGHDLVVTAGVLHTEAIHHGVTRIPDSVRSSLDIRSLSQDTLTWFSSRAEELARDIASARRLTVSMGDRVDTAPASIEPSMAQAIHDAATHCGYQSIMLPSGAGHDAAALADVGIPIGMIFIRNENGSHNPHEAMDLEDFEAGVEILTSVTARAAS